MERMKFKGKDEGQLRMDLEALKREYEAAAMQDKDELQRKIGRVETRIKGMERERVAATLPPPPAAPLTFPQLLKEASAIRKDLGKALLEMAGEAATPDIQMGPVKISGVTQFLFCVSAVFWFRSLTPDKVEKWGPLASSLAVGASAVWDNKNLIWKEKKDGDTTQSGAGGGAVRERQDDTRPQPDYSGTPA